jgi:hypothetical protein
LLGGPGFAYSQEAVKVFRRKVLPSFDQLIGLEKTKEFVQEERPPAGNKAYVFIEEASSNKGLEQIPRELLT